jgi:hypothetical protein
MTCDVARNRLLALPDPRRPTDDLLPHLAGCAACRAAQAAAVQLDGLLKRLPVPAAERMDPFLSELEAAGPVIRTKPVLPSTLADSGAFKPVVRWLKRIDWKYLGGGVAAAVVIGLGVWLLAPKENGVAKADPPEKMKSDRLARMVKRTNELATTARSPHQRVGVYADWAADLKGEASDVYVAANREEMNTLAGQYEKVVSEGVVAQARLIEADRLTPGERKQVLSDAIKKLGEAETDASRLATEAPPNAREAFGRIARTAQQGRRDLTNIADGNPTKGSQP